MHVTVKTDQVLLYFQTRFRRSKKFEYFNLGFKRLTQIKRALSVADERSRYQATHMICFKANRAYNGAHCDCNMSNKNESCVPFSIMVRDF